MRDLRIILHEYPRVKSGHWGRRESHITVGCAVRLLVLVSLRRQTLRYPKKCNVYNVMCSYHVLMNIFRKSILLPSDSLISINCPIRPKCQRLLKNPKTLYIHERILSCPLPSPTRPCSYQVLMIIMANGVEGGAYRTSWGAPSPSIRTDPSSTLRTLATRTIPESPSENDITGMSLGMNIYHI